MPQEDARYPAREQRTRQEHSDPLIDIRATVRADRRKIERVPVSTPVLKERLPSPR